MSVTILKVFFRNPHCYDAIAVLKDGVFVGILGVIAHWRGFGIENRMRE